MIFQYAVKCFFCGNLEKYDFINPYIIKCSMCNREDVEFDVYLKDNGKNLGDLVNMWKEYKPKQLISVGEYNRASCKYCDFKGIIWIKQEFCPFCAKKSIIHGDSVFISFDRVLQMWNVLNKYLNNTKRDQLEKDYTDHKIIYSTKEGLPMVREYVPKELEILTIDVNKICKEYGIDDNEPIILDENGIKLENPNVEELYE